MNVDNQIESFNYYPEESHIHKKDDIKIYLKPLTFCERKRVLFPLCGYPIRNCLKESKTFWGVLRLGCPVLVSSLVASDTDDRDVSQFPGEKAR